MQPKISVVMTCYNSEKFIKEAIDSILSQTFKDFEFIIWNDGSTDKTEEIIKSYTDSRIKYFYHVNTGCGLASYMACKKAIGKYIARMDADDISLPTRFEKEVEYLEKYPQIVAVSSAVRYIDDDGNYLGDSFPYTSSLAIKKCFNRGSCMVHPATMIRRYVYEKSGGYLNMKRGLDHVLFSRLLKYGNFYNFSEPLLCYRISENSISTSASNNPYSDVICLMRKKIINENIVSREFLMIYNNLVDIAKDSCSFTVKSINNIRKKNTINLKEQSLFLYIKKIVGEKKARSLICNLKNIYAILLL